MELDDHELDGNNINDHEFEGFDDYEPDDFDPGDQARVYSLSYERFANAYAAYLKVKENRSLNVKTDRNITIMKHLGLYDVPKTKEEEEIELEKLEKMSEKYHGLGNAAEFYRTVENEKYEKESKHEEEAQLYANNVNENIKDEIKDIHLSLENFISELKVNVDDLSRLQIPDGESSLDTDTNTYTDTDTDTRGGRIEDGFNMIESIVNKIKDSIDTINVNFEKKEDKYNCSVCYLNRKCRIFEPCNHLACCKNCAIKIMRGNHMCPICNKYAFKITKAYIF